MFSGGALLFFRIRSWHMLTYLQALLCNGKVMFPMIERLCHRTSGLKKINQYTRYLIIGIALIQSYYSVSLLACQQRVVLISFLVVVVLGLLYDCNHNDLWFLFCDVAG